MKAMKWASRAACALDRCRDLYKSPYGNHAELADARHAYHQAAECARWEEKVEFELTCRATRVGWENSYLREYERRMKFAVAVAEASGAEVA